MADHRQISRCVLEAFTAGDLDVLEGVFTTDCVVHDTQNPFAADARGLPAGERTSTVTSILIDRFEGDQIAETWSSWDALGMLQQLGAIPAAEPAPAASA